MARVSIFFKAAFICLLLSACVSSDDLLETLRFTRNALLGFSRVVRGSTRDSEEARRPTSQPEKEKATAKPMDSRRLRPSLKNNATSLLFRRPPPLYASNSVVSSYAGETHSSTSEGGEQAERLSLSNKELEIENEIEKAVVNAKAMDSRRLRHKENEISTLTRLFQKSVNSKSYSYARDVLGKLLYLIKTDSSKRRKRSPETASQRFLRKLKEKVGGEKVDSFMAVDGNVALMFVIDDTGSMSDEIEAVKNIATAIVNVPREAPVEYILSPFNDPMTEAAEVVIKDNDSAGEFIQAINDLKAHEGGDCPEYAFQGMLNALEQAEWGGYLYNSPMYVFTDAGPKDAENMDLVMDIARLNRVTINILSTGSCEDGFHQAFLKIAKETSGKVLLFKKEAEMQKLAKVIEDTLEGTATIGSGSSLSGRSKRSSERQSRHRFPVDDSMETLIVYVTTTQETYGRGITLRNPIGTIVTAEKLIFSKISVYHIIEPAKGSWTLGISEEETGKYEFYLESSSEINTDFKVYFTIPLGRGRRKVEVPLSNPIAGKSNKLVLRLFSRERKVNTSSLHLHIVTESGDVIRTFDLQSTDSRYVISFTPPSTPFKLKLIGTTHQGHRFEREYPRKIKPTTAVLRGKYASNDFTLPLSKTSFLHFQICNFGASERFDIVARNDTMGYIQHPSAASQRPKFVLKDRCISIYLRARATRPADVNKMDTVVLKAKGKSSGVEISAQMRLLVDDIKG